MLAPILESDVMRLLKFLLGAILLLAAIVVVGGFLLPDQVHVERAIVIERSPAQVHDILNSYKRFNEWSPWAEKDPNAIYTYSGPAVGVGAKLAWVGNQEVGSGSQEIIASVDQRVETALDFGENGKGTAAFVLTPEGQGTRVVWAFDTDFEGNLIGRWFGLLMEKMLAPDYEQGLAKLKTLLESEPVLAPVALAPEMAAGFVDAAPRVPAPGASAALMASRIAERRRQLEEQARREEISKSGDQ